MLHFIISESKMCKQLHGQWELFMQKDYFVLSMFLVCVLDLHLFITCKVTLSLQRAPLQLNYIHLTRVYSLLCCSQRHSLALLGMGEHVTCSPVRVRIHLSQGGRNTQLWCFFLPRTLSYPLSCKVEKGLHILQCHDASLTTSKWTTQKMGPLCAPRGFSMVLCHLWG